MKPKNPKLAAELAGFGVVLIVSAMMGGMEAATLCTVIALYLHVVVG